MSEGTDVNEGITEEDCCYFIADHMAPFTAPSKQLDVVQRQARILLA